MKNVLVFQGHHIDRSRVLGQQPENGLSVAAADCQMQSILMVNINRIAQSGASFERKSSNSIEDSHKIAECSPTAIVHRVDQSRLVIQELLRNAHLFGAVQGSLLA